ASFAIYRKIIKVQEIAATRTGSSLQANGALLDRIVRCSVNRNPVSASIVGGSHVQVPDVFAVQSSAIRVAGAGRSKAWSGAHKSEGCTIIVAGNDDWEHGMRNCERSAHVGVACPGRATIP